MNPGTRSVCRVFVIATSQRPSLLETLATAYNLRTCPWALLMICEKLKAVRNDRVQVFAIPKNHPDIFHIVVGKISLFILGKFFLDIIQ